jgi:hypothetical protein
MFINRIANSKFIIFGTAHLSLFPGLTLSRLIVSRFPHSSLTTKKPPRYPGMVFSAVSSIGY